ncbi:hypothetical protein D3C87_1760930 [compost metagenome]
MRADQRLSSLLIAHIVEEGYFAAPDEKNTIFTVSAKYTTGRYAMTIRIMKIIKLWFEEYSGFAATNDTLIVQCALPAIDNMRHTPAEDSPLRRLGALKCEREVALFVEDYTAAAELQEEINHLTVQIKQEVA